jgi:hypothetical protein
MLLFAACDTNNPIEAKETLSQQLTSDADFLRLSAYANDIAISSSGKYMTSEDIILQMMDNPEIAALASSIKERYTDLNEENASVALSDMRAQSQNSNSKACDDYCLCLGSVTALGAVMMGGCSAITAGIGAGFCAAGVFAWVGIESEKCRRAA